MAIFWSALQSSSLCHLNHCFNPVKEFGRQRMVLGIGGQGEQHHAITFGEDAMRHRGFQQNQLSRGYAPTRAARRKGQRAGDNLHGDLATGGVFAQALTA